jgi:hypothetical protein
MSFTSISNNPILRGLPETGTQPMTVEPHRDADHIPNCKAIKLATGFYRGVDDFGTVDDTKLSAGSGERFIPGVGNIMIARRITGDYWFMVA